MDRIVLAYSGGLHSSAAIPWLADTYSAEIVTVTLLFGQGRELDGARERALAASAVRAHVLDVSDELARAFLVPALQAGWSAEGRPLGALLDCPLIAAHLAHIAELEGATTVAHGCGPDDPDRARIESSIRSLAPALAVIAPVCDWNLTASQVIDYARQRGMPVPLDSETAVVTETSLWGRSVEGGSLIDPWVEAPEKAFTLTKPAAHAPDAAAFVEIEFERGVPIAANGVSLPPVELLSSLETIAGAHGVGRIDRVEHAANGAKSRKIYEAPAVVLLQLAHRDLQAFVSAPEADRLALALGREYADLVEDGLWHSPRRAAIAELVVKMQETVTGTVRLKLFKGQCRVVGRRSPFGWDGHAGPAYQDPALEPASLGKK